jgi:hypothetical protein
MFLPLDAPWPQAGHVQTGRSSNKLLKEGHIQIR